MTAQAYRILLISFFIVGFQSHAQNPGKIRLVFAGDIMCHETQLNSAYDSITLEYNFDSYFEDIRPLLQTADLSVANLETTLPGQSYTGYPAFGSPDQLVKTIRTAGFNCLTTANNHSFDKGFWGIQRTIQVLNQHQVLHTGTFVSEEEKDMLNPLILEIQKKKIALLNYSYGINSDCPIPEYLINIIDTTLIKLDIQKSKNLNSDFIIVYLHWGQEYETEPGTEQNNLSEWLHKQGVQLLIGSHPHVVQPVEVVKGKDNSIEHVTAYSLGNLISNQRSPNRTKGMILEVILCSSPNELRIEKVRQYPTLVTRKRNGDQFIYKVTLPFWPSPTSQIVGL